MISLPKVDASKLTAATMRRSRAAVASRACGVPGAQMLMTKLSIRGQPMTDLRFVGVENVWLAGGGSPPLSVLKKLPSSL